jgi:HlyD family secretion protein
MTNSMILKARNVSIGFFVVIFIMFFFSKSIITLFLPKVLVEPAVEGTVERTLQMEGTIGPKNSRKIR